MDGVREEQRENESKGKRNGIFGLEPEQSWLRQQKEKNGENKPKRKKRQRVRSEN